MTDAIETPRAAGRVWCLSAWEPIVSFSEFYFDDVPWCRLWSSYVVMPADARFLGHTYGQSENGK